MATISVDAFNDASARTAGEAITISSGARYTQRTDSRLHANAPASMTGSYGSVDYTGIGGEYYIDATKVRWMPFNTGTGNVPAIGTTISQGGITGYFLGVWSAYTAAPTTSGTAMPTSGYIKFREVNNGSYIAGALTGIGANAVSPDVAGWIEVVYDAASNIVVPRVGSFKSRFQWFYLDNTNGSVGQQIQIPSTSSAQTNNFCPGAWVETAPGSNVYDRYEGLNGATNGWARTYIGHAKGFTDKRTKFVKTTGNGVIQFGEAASVSATYASLAAQAGAYAAFTASGTYVWSGNIVTINTGATAHLLEPAMQVGLDFTSGSGVDAIFTVATIIDAYNFTCAYAGSGTGGNVTCRIGITVTFTAHTLNIGDSVYCDFTSGSGVDGTYTVFSVDSANIYKLMVPTTAAITSGNVSCLHTLVITATAHGHAIGNEVLCTFTSGGATNGRYIMKIIAANTISINFAHSVVIATSNVTLEWTIGYVPISGCKVRIPNIFISECATGARATNTIPNATIASRPELTTTNAGAIDLEGLYCFSFYVGAIAQAYSLRLISCAFSDSVNISEIATALDIDDIVVGMYLAQDLVSFTLTSCFAGGTVNNITAHRGNTPGTTDHAFTIAFCNSQTFNNLDFGIIQYARSTGKACNIATNQNLTFNGMCIFNGNIDVATSVNIILNNIDYSDRFIGRTSATTPYYIVSILGGCDKITVNGISLGLGNTIPDCHPYNGLVNVTASTNIKFRNFGTYASPLNTGSWAVNAYGCGNIYITGGNNNTVKLQKIYTQKLRSAYTTFTNSDKNITYEQVYCNTPFTYGVKSAHTPAIACLNGTMKGITSTIIPTISQISVYGTHIIDYFTGNIFGEVALYPHEPTVETQSYVTINSGVVKFNSAGGVEMRAIGAQCTWEMQYFAQGHTSFRNITPVMTGGTIGNYTLEYQIDSGNGYSAWKTLSGANLNAENFTVFKLKIRVTTTTINATAITSIKFYTNTTSSAQAAIAYPLDTYTLTLTGLSSGSDVVIYSTGTTTVRNSVDSANSFSYIYETPENIDIGIFKAGYIPLYIRNYALGLVNSSLPIAQVIDRAYLL